MSAVVDIVEPRMRGGQRPAIIRAQREQIMRLIREKGAPPTTAAVACGVPRRTHEDWLRRGRMENGPEPCRRYAEAVDLAVELWKLDRIATVQGAESEDYRAAQFLLERRFPKEFGQSKRVDSRVQVQVTPVVAWEKLSPERAQLLVELLREASPDADDPAITETARPALELVEGEGFVELVDD